MRLRPFRLALVGLILAACEQGGGELVRASGVVVYAPLPATDTAVAYLTLHNDTRADLEIARVSSNEFTSVSLHETRIENNRSEMHALGSLSIAAGSSVDFEPGGKHVMLRSPRNAVAAGSPVSLKFHDVNGVVLELDTTLQNRNAAAAPTSGVSR